MRARGLAKRCHRMAGTWKKTENRGFYYGAYTLQPPPPPLLTQSSAPLLWGGL